jgi:hypothetical protein
MKVPNGIGIATIMVNDKNKQKNKLRIISQVKL